VWLGTSVGFCQHSNELELHRRRIIYLLAHRPSASRRDSPSWNLHRCKCEDPYSDFQENSCVSFGRTCSGTTISFRFRDFRVDIEERGIVPIWFIRT
jgi:hypothetical protein